jgi:hypothetical protein
LDQNDDPLLRRHRHPVARLFARQARTLDPAVAIPLLDQGLLHILEPEQIVDKTATEKLSAAMTEIINSGALDKLDKNGEFHEISYSRMGGFGEEALARQLFESLEAKGLARDSEDGTSIPMQPMVRSLIWFCCRRFFAHMVRNLVRSFRPPRIGRNWFMPYKNSCRCRICHRPRM